MSEVVYKIVNWNELYENNRTREMKKMSWVPVPNNHDGDGYTELLDHENGPAHLGAWMVILQLASKCDVRGTLLRSGGKPHTFETISRITRFPAEVIKEAIGRLIEIGWVEAQTIENKEDAKIPHPPAVFPHPPAVIPHPTDEGTERKERTTTTRAEGKWEDDVVVVDDEIILWLKTTPKVTLTTHVLRAAHNKTLAQLKDTWKTAVNTPRVLDKRAFFVSLLRDSVP